MAEAADSPNCLKIGIQSCFAMWYLFLNICPQFLHMQDFKCLAWICVFNELLCVNVLLHVSHLYGRRPLWVRRWYTRWCLILNRLSHSGQGKGRFSYIVTSFGLRCAPVTFLFSSFGLSNAQAIFLGVLWGFSTVILFARPLPLPLPRPLPRPLPLTGLYADLNNNTGLMSPPNCSLLISFNTFSGLKSAP